MSPTPAMREAGLKAFFALKAKGPSPTADPEAYVLAILEAALAVSIPSDPASSSEAE